MHLFFNIYLGLLSFFFFLFLVIIVIFYLFTNKQKDSYWHLELFPISLMILVLIELGHYIINSSRIAIIYIARCRLIVNFNDN
jgi:hypothetical protein